MCPPPGFYGLLVFIFLPSLDLSLISGVPCVKIKVINQFSVYLLHIQSLHCLAEIALHVQGSLKEQFWTLSGSLNWRHGDLRSWDHLRCRTGLAFLAKVASVLCNMQMVKCGHQILLERKMNFYVRGTSFRTLFIDFLALILHNLPEAVIKASCFSWYRSIGLVYTECILWQVLSKIVAIIAVLSLFQNRIVKRITIREHLSV